jgi:tRNA(fMet)-specific endonuclease VapC
VARYLLDTNICIAVMRSHPVAVQRLAAVAPGDCAISTVTAYELYTGVEKCAKPAQERSKVELLLTTVWEMPFDPDAARESARLRALLESQGQAIGPYDVLLAGQALARSLVLVTGNTKEFSRVPGLTLENWLV